jgi:hypothetical protein
MVRQAVLLHITKESDDYFVPIISRIKKYLYQGTSPSFSFLSFLLIKIHNGEHGHCMLVCFIILQCLYKIIELIFLSSLWQWPLL